MVRVFKLKDAPVSDLPLGRGRLFMLADEKSGARNVGVMVAETKPGSKPGQYHYHTKRETVYIVLRGRAKALIDGKEYLFTPGTVAYVAPGEKHRTVNIGKTAFRMIEIYSPLEPDRVDVPEEKV
jgi:mannose-6-phosphate isomerase-like protein (cupin superfamily)